MPPFKRRDFARISWRSRPAKMSVPSVFIWLSPPLSYPFRTNQAVKREVELLQEESNQADLQRKKTDRLHDFVTDLEELKEKHGKKKIPNPDFGTLETLDSTLYTLRGLMAQSKKVGHVADMLRNFAAALKAL